MALSGCKKNDAKVFGFGEGGIEIPYEASMVGSETCGLCHKDHVGWQLSSHMALTGRVVTKNNAHLWFSDEDLARPSRRPASAIRRGPRYRRSDEEVSLVYGHDSSRARVDAVFGSGAHGFTPVELNSMTSVRELSVSFLADPGVWFATPGQQNQRQSVGHDMPPEDATSCITCHATAAVWRQDTLDVEASAFGVQCERCHGPGSAHVEAMVRRREDPKIFNPASLNSKQQVEFCGQCHRKTLDLDPKQVIADAAETARHAGAALMLSACFRASPAESAISCTDCHNPHRNIADSDPFNATCLSCHGDPRSDHTDTANDASADCVQCHMRKSTGLGHIEFTSHWIRNPAQQEIGQGPVRHEYLTHLDSVYQDALLDEDLGPMSRSDLLLRSAQARVLLVPTPLSGPEPAELLEAALVLDPRYWAKLEIAAEFSGLGRSDRAIQILQQMVQNPPGYNDAYEQLAGLFRANDDARAEVIELEWSQSLPGDRRLGNLLISQGRHAEAEAHFRRALQIDPGAAAAQAQLGNLSRRRGDFAAAVEHYRLAVDNEPDYVDAYVRLGQTLAAQGHEFDAIDQFRRALEVDSTFASAHTELGMTLARRGDYDEASGHLLAALAADSTSSRAHWGMGRVREFQGRLRQAVRHYRASAKVRANPEVFSRLAWILATTSDAGLRDGNEAVRLSRQVAQMTRYKDPTVLSVLAAAFAAVEAFDSSRAIARRALAIVGADSTTAGRNLRVRLESYVHQSAK